MAAGPRRAEGRSLRRWAYCAGATLPVPRLCERFAAVKYGSRSLSARAGKQLYEQARRSVLDRPKSSETRFVLLRCCRRRQKNRAVYVCQGVLYAFRWFAQPLCSGLTQTLREANQKLTAADAHRSLWAVHSVPRGHLSTTECETRAAVDA